MNLMSYLSGVVESLHQENREGSAKIYKTATDRFLNFVGEKTTFEEVFTRQELAQFELSLTRDGCKLNTISSYMRVLQRCYNLASDDGLLEKKSGLFSRVFTGRDTTTKRALNTKLINKLAKAKLSKKNLEFARDMFLLCFHLQGASFIDVCYLKKSDLEDGFITYQRKKCGSQIVVHVGKEAMEIIEKYAHLTEGTPYLVPIIVDPNKDERKQYESALRTHNRRLKKVAEKSGIKENLTSYVARHSWATAAYHSNVPTAIIKQALGHKTEETTSIYLKEFEYKDLKKASETVSQALREQAERDEIENVRYYTSNGHFDDANIGVSS